MIIILVTHLTVYIAQQECSNRTTKNILIQYYVNMIKENRYFFIVIIVFI